MSAYSTLVIHRGDEALEGSIVRIVEDAVDTEYGIQQRGDDIWFVAFESKYTVDGLENAAQELSLALRCRVDVVEEWDNRDADEQGREAYSYDRGRKVTEERTLEVPAGVEVVAVPVETLRQWRGWLEQQPFPQVGRVATGIDVYLT